MIQHRPAPADKTAPPRRPAEEGRYATVDARVSKSLSLTSEWMQAIFADPTLLDDVPDGATVYLIPDDDPEFAEMVQRNVERARSNGQLMYVHHMHQSEP